MKWHAHIFLLQNNAILTRSQITFACSGINSGRVLFVCATQVPRVRGVSSSRARRWGRNDGKWPMTLATSHHVAHTAPPACGGKHVHLSVYALPPSTRTHEPIVCCAIQTKIRSGRISIEKGERKRQNQPKFGRGTCAVRRPCTYRPSIGAPPPEAFPSSSRTSKPNSPYKIPPGNL